MSYPSTLMARPIYFRHTRWPCHNYNVSAVQRQRIPRSIGWWNAQNPWSSEMLYHHKTNQIKNYFYRFIDLSFAKMLQIKNDLYPYACHSMGIIVWTCRTLYHTRCICQNPTTWPFFSCIVELKSIGKRWKDRYCEEIGNII